MFSHAYSILKRIGRSLKETYPDSIHQEIPLKRIAGLQDILSHEYFGIDTQIVWDVITNNFENPYMAVPALQTDYKTDELSVLVVESYPGVSA